MPSISSSAARSAATAIALTAAAGAASVAHSADRLVPQQYATIQAAINAASAGDHVVIAPGTYVQSISFLGKPLVVRPSGSPLSVTLRAPAGARAVSFVSGETSSAVLRGVRLEGYGPTGTFGGGVLVQGSSPMIEQCEFHDIHSRITEGNWGGALDVVSGSPVIRACVFNGNRATRIGGGGDGGALLARGGNPAIERCTFRDNPGSSGSDVFLVSAAPVNVMMTDCRFEGVSGGSHGARIYNYGQGGGTATLTLTDCTFRGIVQDCVSLIHGWDTIIMQGVEFDSCHSSTGRIVTQSRSRLTVQGCSFTENSMPLIDCDPTQGGDSLVVGSAFCGNSPGGNPFGPLVIDGGFNTVRIECCRADITSNGHVDALDLAALLGAWGTDGGTEFDCDIDRDGFVGGADLSYVLGSWGQCPE